MAPPKAKQKMVYTSGKKTAAKLDSNNSIEWFKTSLSQYKLKADTKNKFDILPYTARKGNRNAEEGNWHYELSVYVHKGLGSDGRRQVICPAKMKGGNCPICAYISKHRAEMTDQERGALSAKHRQIFIVLDRLAEDANQRIKFFETSYKMGFGELLSNTLSAEADDDPIQHLHSLQEGQTVVVSAKNKSYSGNTYVAPVTLKTEPRKKPLPESILEQYENPEDCLIYLDEAEIKKIFTSGIGGVEEVPSVDEDDEDDDKDEMDADELEDDEEDGDDEDSDASDDTDDGDSDSDDDDDDEDDKPAPKAKSGKAKPAPAAVEDDEEDADDDEESDETDDEEDEADDEDASDDDGDDDEDEKPKGKKKQKTAKECGISLKDKVKHAELGICEVTHISGDGTSLKLKDKSGEVHMAMAPEDCTVIKSKESAKPAKEEKTEKKAGKKPPVADDDDEW